MTEEATRARPKESIAVDPDTYALSAAADPRGLWAVGAPIVLKP